MVGADRRGRVIEILKYHHISKGNNYDLKFTTQNVTLVMLFRKKKTGVDYICNTPVT